MIRMKTNIDSPQDSKRLRGFLLGLVLGLALLLAGLEYTSYPARYDDDEDALSDMDQDLEMMSPVHQSDMISAVQGAASKAVTAKSDMISAVQGAASKAVTANVKAVDNASEMPDKVGSTTSTLVIGNGEGETKTANVTEALPQVPAETEDTTVLRTVEKLPEYPGGIVEFMKWLSHSLHYPPQARARKIQGKVVVSFIVNKNGTISSPKIEKHADPMLDAEALRVIKLMPRWKPGIMNEKPCRTMIAIPINFVL